MQDALVKLLAWRLDVAHVDPLSTVVYTSGGNAKFKAGKIVTLRAISGHRDTGPSECPGNDAYALLPAIAKRVSLTGLPKLYSPTVAGALGGPVRFQARVSSALPWTVTITDQLGKIVASGTGPRPARRLDVELARRGQGPLHLDDRGARARGRRRGRSGSAVRCRTAARALAHEPRERCPSSSPRRATGPAARRPSRSRSVRRRR